MSLKLKSRIHIAVALMAGLVTSVPAWANDGITGAYLVARQAYMDHEYATAAEYYSLTLEQDPTSERLLEGAMVTHMSLGDFKAATPFANRLQKKGGTSNALELILTTNQLLQEDYAAVIADFQAGRKLAPFFEDILLAWCHIGLGNISEAMNKFDEAPSGDHEYLLPVANYYKALALTLLGDLEGADALFAQADEGKITQNHIGALTHAQVLGQLGRHDDALAVLDRQFGTNPAPDIVALRAELENGNAPRISMISSTVEGVGHTMSGVLQYLVANDAHDTVILIYGRATEILAPERTSGIMFSAEILTRQGQFELAAENYSKIPYHDPDFHETERRRAIALYSANKTEDAIKVLEQLSKSHADKSSVHAALATVFYMEKRYSEAIRAYDKAIETMRDGDKYSYELYLNRGWAHNWVGEGDKAEADFRKALEVDPDQPGTLNDLGYFLLEQGRDYEEALSMIERAVKELPENGGVVDSYGWGLYLVGRYEEAVEPMERAVALIPFDPVINDHLGDVLWAVGRRSEAKFQWRRALSLDPKVEDAPRIRRKLEIGLDAVLEEEGAEPLASVRNGDD